MQAKPVAAGKKKEEEEVDPTAYRQNRIATMEKREVCVCAHRAAAAAAAAASRAPATD